MMVVMCGSAWRFAISEYVKTARGSGLFSIDIRHQGVSGMKEMEEGDVMLRNI
jgi:hypothetical protein